MTIVLAMGLIVSTSNRLLGNDIYITQSGNGLDLDITQDGNNNRVSTKSTAASNATLIGKNQTINFTQTGDNNKIGLYKHTYGSDTQTSSTMKAVQTGNNLIMYLDNHGDNNNMDAEQIHNNAIMDLEIDYNNNDVIAKQKCSEISCDQDRMILNIYGGNNNEVMLGQGYGLQSDGTWQYGGQEHGGHYMNVYISGDNNDLMAAQKANNTSTEQSLNTYVLGDNNDIHLQQYHNGDKTLNLYVYNNDNDVHVKQQKTYAQTATISLNGSYGTTLNLQMGTNNTTQAGFYSLSQNCQTVGGCSISATQN